MKKVLSLLFICFFSISYGQNLHYDFTSAAANIDASNIHIDWKLCTSGLIEYSTSEIALNDGFLSKPLVSAVEEMDTRAAVNLYPNPIQDYLMLDINSPHLLPATVRVFDYKGKVLVEKELINETESVDCSAWARGVYLINIELKNDISQSVKLIKQ